LHSDSLHRHLLRHGDEFKPTPSGRSKKACITCHKGKIKCDGNQPCSKCASKGSECRYEQPTASAQVASSSDTGQDQSPTEVVEAMPPNFFDAASNALSKTGLIDWLALKVQNDANKQPQISLPDTPAGSLDSNDAHTRPMAPDHLEESYIDLYFKYFHHRWPIVHRPSFAGSELGLFLKCAMKMIGAWHCGTGESMMYSLAMHGYLMVHLPSMLVGTTL
jgi:hypothetical protein